MNKENINEYLMKLGKNKFSQIISNEGLGSKIYEEVKNLLRIAIHKESMHSEKA